MAASKRQPATAIAELAAAIRALQRDVTGSACEQAPAFGENYVQEACAKHGELAGMGLEWHLIGHLQSNKAADAASLFDWVQTVDRASLASALGRHRPANLHPLQVLVQVNIDDEDSKHGCAASDVMPLADTIAATPNLVLRGLMAIPAPLPDLEQRRAAFRRARLLFEALRQVHPQADTLSMGMSEDFTIAIEEGATMIRLGTILFGARPRKDPAA